MTREEYAIESLWGFAERLEEEYKNKTLPADVGANPIAFAIREVQKELQATEAKLEKAMGLLEEIEGVPTWVEPATVPAGGAESTNPEHRKQVVLNLSVGWDRMLRIREFLDWDKIFARDGVLWRGGEVVPAPEADSIARKNGFVYAEQYVKHLTELQEAEENG